MTTETKAPTIVQQLMADVSDNPTQVKWPRDKWGITTELKKAVLLSASTVRDNQDKHDTLLNTLAVAIAHVQKRRAKDARVRTLGQNDRAAAHLERAPRERVSATVIEPTT